MTPHGNIATTAKATYGLDKCLMLFSKAFHIFFLHELINQSSVMRPIGVD